MHQFNNFTIAKYILLMLISLFLFPSKTLSTGTDLHVPFTSQAPEANWSQPWQDACEEAAVLMVDKFYSGHTLDKISAKAGILQLMTIKNNYFGYSLDENAKQIAELVNLFFPWEAHLVKNPTIADLKAELDAGRPIIIPVNGNVLKNPHFLSRKTFYHTIVLSGYNDDKKEFITEEPGTRYGLDFRYSYDTILDAIHDFLPGGKTDVGEKIAVFTNKKLTNFGDTDGDHDGLVKSEEMKYGTILWLTDSDGDGYLDGEEVSNGFSPTLAEKGLSNSSLVKSANNPKVYLLQNNTKRYIVNGEVFLSHGWKWNDIVTVSEKFIEDLEDGPDVV